MVLLFNQSAEKRIFHFDEPYEFHASIAVCIVVSFLHLFFLLLLVDGVF